MPFDLDFAGNIVGDVAEEVQTMQKEEGNRKRHRTDKHDDYVARFEKHRKVYDEELIASGIVPPNWNERGPMYYEALLKVHDRMYAEDERVLQVTKAAKAAKRSFFICSQFAVSSKSLRNLTMKFWINFFIILGL